ncbi:acyltransferase family protein [Heyndrickxia sporothermodurans]
MIKEWNLLRTLACLSVVFLHSTTQTIRAVGSPDIILYDFFRMALCYATPTFVVLSEIILANKYPDRLPNKFWSKRLKWILSPFIIFAIIDAFISKDLNPNVMLFQKIINNIFTGTFVGYFVLVIFQFYILHYIVTKFNISMKFLIPISIFIMSLQLDILESDVAFIQENRIHFKIPFTAWFAYFTIAFYIGKNYKNISKILLKYKIHTLVAVFVSLGILYISYLSGNNTIGSHRFDLLPLVLSISAAVIAWGQVLPNFKIINYISNYSFGIYLIHWQIQRYLAPYTAEYFNHTSTRVISLFLLSVILAMAIIKIISLFPFGSYIVGNVKRKYSKKVKELSTANIA